MTQLVACTDGVLQDVSRLSTETLQLDEQNPWPGLAAYDEASHQFFCGRSQEASELLQLILLAPLTVVYGKSGLGKTSLLQAGLYPLLRNEHFLPVHLRIDFSGRLKILPLMQVMQRLIEELEKVRAEYPQPGSDESLWGYLHRKDLDIWSEDNFPLTPVLVFDQFEELFSRSEGNVALIKQFFYGLADLIENRIPVEIASEEARPMRSNLDLRSQRYRIVLSFREDFLPEVRTWEQTMPSLLRYSLRLEPMSRQRAIDAVVQAGKAVLENHVAPFIVDFVGKDQTVDATSISDIAIEPVLLSLCCYQLNRRREPGTLVDRALVEVAGQDILDSFYRQALEDPEVMGPPDVSIFIENYLIQGDRFRGDYSKEGALNDGKLTGMQLTVLTDRHRLLRLVPHQDTTRIELIHDRLVPVVRKARDERRIKQHKEEQEQLARVAQADRDKERARSEELQRQRDAANQSFKTAKKSRNIATVVAIVSLFIIVWGLYLKQQKEQLKQRMALALDTTSIAEGKRALKPGIEPLEQTLYHGLAAYRLAEGFPELKTPSLTALHSAMGVSGHLRKVLRIDQLVPTTALVYSPDGKTLAVGSENGVILLLDAGNFRETGRLNCSTSSAESVWAIAYNSDGKRLTAGHSSNDEKITGSGLVCVFDVPQRSIIRKWSAQELTGNSGDIYGVAYGGKPGAEFVISGGSDKILRRYDVKSGIVSKIHLKEEISGVAVSADGLKVASSGTDTIIKLWNLTDFDKPNVKPLELREHEATIQQLMFSPNDPSVLVSVGDDGYIIAWDIKGGCIIQKSKPQPARIINVAISKDKLVAAASADGNVRLFWLNGKSEQCRTVKGKAITSSFDVIPDGVLSGHGGSVMGVAFNPESDDLASTAQDGSIRIWGPKTDGFSLAQLDLGSGFGSVTSLATSPDGQYIVAGDDKGTINVWDRPNADEPLRQPAAASWKAHEKAIHSLVYIRIGNQLALVTGGEDGVLKRWDTASQKTIGLDMEDNAKPVRSIALSPDGKLLAAGSSDGTVRLWDVATGKRDRTIDKPNDAEVFYDLYAVGFSVDGKHLAVGDTVRGLRLLDLENPDFERRLHGNADATKALSRGGKMWLLSAGADGNILEWDHASLLRTQTKGIKKQDEFKFSMRSRRAKPLTSLAASENGELIISGGKEGQVQLWHGLEHVLIGPRFFGREQKNNIQAIAMAPDSSYFVTADDASKVLVWPGPDRWANILCSKLVSNMSRKQWREWFSKDIPYTCQCPELPILPDDPKSGKPAEICPTTKSTRK